MLMTRKILAHVRAWVASHNPSSFTFTSIQYLASMGKNYFPNRVVKFSDKVNYYVCRDNKAYTKTLYGVK